MASKLVEAAVRATQLYGACMDKVRASDAQKLYRRQRAAIARVAKQHGMSEADASEQIVAEARRRGYICPVPGKDI